MADRDKQNDEGEDVPPPSDSDHHRDDDDLDDDGEIGSELNFAASSDTTEATEPRGGALTWALAVTSLVAIAFTIGLRRDRHDSSLAFGLLGAVYAALGVVAVMRLRARGELWMLRPRSGDVTIGAFVGAILYGLALAAHLAITSKAPFNGWVFQIYLLMGDSLSDARVLISIALGVVGALEELAWRGLVLPILEERMGPARASVTTTLFYAAAHVPTLFLLADPAAGRNPLLVLAAFGCGLVWAYLRFRTGRLAPVILAHGLFTWAIVEFPIWRP